MFGLERLRRKASAQLLPHIINELGSHTKVGLECSLSEWFPLKKHCSTHRKPRKRTRHCFVVRRQIRVLRFFASLSEYAHFTKDFCVMSWCGPLSSECPTRENSFAKILMFPLVSFHTLEHTGMLGFKPS